MCEKIANKKRLSEERLESSPEVDRALYKHTIIIIIIIIIKIIIVIIIIIIII